MFKHQKNKLLLKHKNCKIYIQKKLFVARHHFHQLLGRKETFALIFFRINKRRRKKKVISDLRETKQKTYISTLNYEIIFFSYHSIHPQYT
jgi:hypothetical protein